MADEQTSKRCTVGTECCSPQLRTSSEGGQMGPLLRGTAAGQDPPLLHHHQSTDLQPMSRLLMVDRGPPPAPPALAPSVERLSSELRPGGCGLLESPVIKAEPRASHRQSGEQGENRGGTSDGRILCAAALRLRSGAVAAAG
ncbi:unnamed protein product [Gadus morhua 'NCC']